MALKLMRCISKVGNYFPSTRTVLLSPFRIGENVSNARTITRSLFFLTSNRDSTKGTDHFGITSITSPWTNACSCGCSVHTKGEKELATFLEEEIANETRAQKREVPSELEDFNCRYEGSEITLMKKFNHEVVTIKANINHSVDAEESSADPSEAKDEQEMKAKPDFRVEISKGSKILSFECQFTEMADEDKEGPYNDAFEITEISMYEGEYLDSTYSVSADIMDGYLYDLLMNYLEERGISSDFADKLILLFTSYEHKKYINLLQDMKQFVGK